MRALTVILASAAVLAAVSLAFAEDNEARGIELYRKVCSGCHGNIENTTKPGRRPARISSAIKNNIGGMSALRGKLTDGDIDAISEALSLVEPPHDADGAKLYDMYCSACHRPLDKTDIRGKGIDDIKAGIKDRMCQTVNLRFLDDGQLDMISEALNKKAE